MRALLIEHERAAPGGLIAEWLAERGAAVDVLAIDEQLDGHGLDPRDYGLIVSLGSDFAAYDDSLPWLAHEIDLLRDAVAADVPVLGVCFGGQLLARVLGGAVARSHTEEIGWRTIGSKDAGVVPDGPWFTWHFDSFTPPPGARLLAHNEIGAQAYCVRRCLGIQFHPEVTPAIIGDWVRLFRDELEQHGVDPEGLLEETERRAAEVAERTRRLLDTFMARIAQPATRA